MSERIADISWVSRRSGQTHQRGSHDHRDPYERDRTRVIHCPAFRRLQRKTQILRTNEGDFHRTRLTHSLEVASIGRSITRNLAITHPHTVLSDILPSDDLISTICLLHDIGHPPFGHGGEVALNYMMWEDGGFEANGQTLRLLTKLENSYGTYGMDLTRRTLLGIMKYPVKYSQVVALHPPSPSTFPYPTTLHINDWLPPKAYFDSEQNEVSWILEPFNEKDRILFQTLGCSPQAETHGKSTYHSFDCSIMNAADDIAYGVHDLEDAIHLGLIHRDQLDSAVFHELLSATPLDHYKKTLVDSLFHPELYLRKEIIGEMVNYFITALRISITHEHFQNPLLKYNISLFPEALALLTYLKQLIYTYVIDSQQARTFEYGSQTVIMRLFEALNSNAESLLDSKTRQQFQKAQSRSESRRIICDYIANMTDESAYRMHERLFGFNTRTIFERL